MDLILLQSSGLMKKRTIIRCGSKVLTAAVLQDFNGIPRIVDVISVELTPKSDSSDDWLVAVGEALEKIPVHVRYNTEIVVPPNFEVFVKLIKIPHSNSLNFKQALQFEFNHAFRGGVDEWVYDVFQPNKKSDSAYCFAMHRLFVEKFLDCLLRAHVDFNYLCPEHLLNNFALKSKGIHDAVCIHIGKKVSAVTFVGKQFSHVKNISIAGDWINNKISEAADIEYDAAEKRKLDLALDSAGKDVNDSSFIIYYLTQFAQTLSSEIKKSELYYYSRFAELPITKIIVSGNGGNYEQVNSIFEEKLKCSVISDFSIFSDCLDSSLADDKRNLIKQCLGAFYGGALCLFSKDMTTVNLFSEDLQDQLVFQRNSPRYMVLVITFVVFMMLCFKFLASNVVFLEDKKLAFIEKSKECDRNIENYNKMFSAYSCITQGIDSLKQVFDTQAMWINVFSQLQNVMSKAGNTWIDQFEWRDCAPHIAKNNNAQASGSASSKSIKLTLKHFNDKNFSTENAVKCAVDSLMLDIGKMDFASIVKDVQLKKESDEILQISFEIVLKENFWGTFE